MKKHPTLPVLVSQSGDRVFHIEKKREVAIYKWANGYRACKVHNKHQLMHRLVAETYLENPNNFSVVHHKDHNKTNNSVSNLEWSTRSNNTKQAYAAGVFKDSGVGPKKRIDYDEVYRLYTEGKLSKSEIARQMGCSPTHIARVISMVEMDKMRRK